MGGAFFTEEVRGESKRLLGATMDSEVGRVGIGAQEWR